MGWRVVFSARSGTDLQKIVEYIARDSPSVAVQFASTLIEKAEALSGAPEMGPFLPGKPGTRFLPVGPLPDHLPAG